MKAGEWLRRKHDHTELLEVIDVTPDGGVTVRVAGFNVTTNTTRDYLKWQFEPV